MLVTGPCPAPAKGEVLGAPNIIFVGTNDVRLWGLTMEERVRRIAHAQGLSLDDGRGEGLLVNVAYVFDPAWLRFVAGKPGLVLTSGGRAVLAHCRNADEGALVRAAMEGRAGLDQAGSMEILPQEQAGPIVNAELRKREQPFLMELVSGSVRAAERASYFGAYKGVTDILTKYLWPEWALVLTRIAARLGISPNAVTAVAALLCAAAGVLFWYGHYWIGMASGLGFMVLDTVDGKLARCTITSSWWGNIFDHGIDLIHPLLWWYAWGVGLAAYGRPLSTADFRFAMIILVVGYVVQRLIEGAFIGLFKMHIHVWRKFDSDFRLITARRNPNMIILFASMVFRRPDLGLMAVAWWTAISCLVHLVRLLQAMAVRAGGREIRSWLD